MMLPKVDSRGTIEMHLIQEVQGGGLESEFERYPATAHFYCGRKEEAGGSGSLKSGTYQRKEATCQTCIGRYYVLQREEEIDIQSKGREDNEYEP